MAVVTKDNDATINNTTSINNGDLKDLGKITFTLELAAHSDGSSLTYPIFTLTTELQSLRITLDIDNETLTAVDAEGNVINTIEISAPSSTGFSSINEWLGSVGYFFNWQMSAGGGVAFDSFSIYSGDYIVPYSLFT